MNQIAIWCGIIAVRFGVLASVNISWSSDEHCGIAVAQISGGVPWHGERRSRVVWCADVQSEARKAGGTLVVKQGTSFRS